MVFNQGEPLRPTIWDLMPPELREDMQRLPRGIQTLLLNTMAHEEAVQGRLMEVHETLRRGQGLETAELESAGAKLVWKAEERRADTQQQCMVCLADFEDGDELRKLHCDHMFHVDCIDEWLRRSPHCPLCKQPCGGRSTTSSSGSASTSRASGPSAQLLVGAMVICSRGEGKILGYDAASQKFKIQTGGGYGGRGGQEVMMAHEEFVQAIDDVELT